MSFRTSSSINYAQNLTYCNFLLFLLMNARPSAWQLIFASRSCHLTLYLFTRDVSRVSNRKGSTNTNLTTWPVAVCYELNLETYCGLFLYVPYTSFSFFMLDTTNFQPNNTTRRHAWFICYVN